MNTPTAIILAILIARLPYDGPVGEFAMRYESEVELRVSVAAGEQDRYAELPLQTERLSTFFGADRQLTPWPGRLPVVVDSSRQAASGASSVSRETGATLPAQGSR
jgi:hypothetical protein